MKLRRTPPRRRGFTLIELMVVIGIIILLVSLLTGSIILAINKLDQVKTQREIGGLAASLKQFQSDFNLAAPPPSRITLHPTLAQYTSSTATQLDIDSLAYLRKVWPRIFTGSTTTIAWGPNGTAFDNTLEGEECLVFFLGGMQVKNASNQWMCIGFSTDPTNPMNATVTGRKGPYYQFDSTRLVQAPTTAKFLMYLDAYSSNSTGSPYAYFSSGKAANGYNAYTGSDCASLNGGNLQPYYQPSGTTKQYYNADTFQIISAGKDQLFGPGGQWQASIGPANPALTPNGADDQSNFYDSKLGVTP
jgi:general secretion pathway protein G